MTYHKVNAPTCSEIFDKVDHRGDGARYRVPGR